jgi:hypothetical protein
LCPLIGAGRSAKQRDRRFIAIGTDAGHAQETPMKRVERDRTWQYSRPSRCNRAGEIQPNLSPSITCGIPNIKLPERTPIVASSAHETIFALRRNHPETEALQLSCNTGAAVCVRVSSMIDIAAAILGLLSAGIFLAHALDAYHAHDHGTAAPRGRTPVS